MLCAFILSMPQRPEVERLTDYYAKAMMTVPMRWFCRMSGKRKFSEENIAVMKAAAVLKAADRNPYSWNMDFIEYPDGSGYEGALLQVRHLYADARAGTVRPHACNVSFGLHDGRQAMRQILCGSIHSPPAARTVTADIKRKRKIDTAIKSAMHVFC